MRSSERLVPSRHFRLPRIVKVAYTQSDSPLQPTFGKSNPDRASTRLRTTRPVPVPNAATEQQVQALRAIWGAQLILTGRIERNAPSITVS
jgi:hypothetical protein